MNKRIVIIDDDPNLGVNLYDWFGIEQLLIYTTSQLAGMSDFDLSNALSLGEDDGAILVGPGAFKVISDRYHIGIRGENYFDCSYLRRLGLDSGAFIKVYHESDKPTVQDIEVFLSPKFTAKREFPGYTWKVIKDAQEAHQWLVWFKDLPLDVAKGFDYETSGMPMEYDLQITGAALCANQTSIFFSFTEILKNSGQEAYNEFCREFGETLKKQDKSLWAYNLQFEQQVSWRFFGVELELNDTSVYNVMDGLHGKNYSLKWTIQRLLGGGDNWTPSLSDRDKWDHGGIIPWDTDFDRLEELLDSMYFTLVQKPGTKGKKNMEKVLKVDLTTYQGTTEWAEICKRYPDYIQEFTDLIQTYFGKPFMNIPADILGYYCCLDAFYTVEAHTEHAERYTPICHEVFLNNIRLGSLLHRGGMFKDENYRLSYNEECKYCEAYGIIFSATARCKWKMEAHRKKMANPKKYNPIWLTLMERQEFHGGNPLEITKTLLSKNTNEAYDTGFDEGRFMMTYGEDFADFMSKTVKARMTEIKFKGKLDPGVVRKKKLLGLVSEDLKAYLGLPDQELGEKHIELEKFMWYERAYQAFLKIWNSGLTIDNVPDKFWFLGKSWDRDDFTEYILNTFFKCSSPIDSAKITRELTELYPTETLFLTSIYSGINILPDGKNFYSNLGITDPLTGYLHFMKEWEVWWNCSDKSGSMWVWPDGYVPSYPDEFWALNHKFWKSMSKELEEDLTTTWDSFDGYLKQSTYFKFKDDWDLMSKPYSESDWVDLGNFGMMRKLVLHIMYYKKYRKMRTAYTDNGSMFEATDRKVIVDPKTLMPIRDAAPGGEPGEVIKMFPHYEVMKKETKRWSSGYHTIISHSDVKDVIAAPTGYLLTYFDINTIVSLEGDLEEN